MPVRAVVLAAVMALAGCAAMAPPQSQGPLPWLDAEFRQHTLAAIQSADLFRLDEDLERRLEDPAVRDVSAGRRLKYLMDTILGPDRKGFAYQSGQSTTAVQTWRNRSGDCLSLTVLTYAIARKLGLNPVMQEVRTPPIFGRSGELDVVNQHVNVLIPNMRGDLFIESKAHDVVIDFEPDYIAQGRGTPLSEEAIRARFHNNLAVEHMARGENADAYAHFKAAVGLAPAYVSPYGNLAVLYRRIGRSVEAEQLLRHAVALDAGTDVALHELHRLLRDQGRLGEAREVERQLEVRRSADPYHWIGLAVRDLQGGETRRAVRYLQRARDIAPTFAEVPRYLAVAYGRMGQADKAREELALMEALGGPAAKVALLRRKLEGGEPASR